MNKISKLSLGLIIVLVAIFLTAIAFYFYKNETDEIRKEKYQYLEAISNLKIDQITKWNAERLYDAKFVPTIGKFIKSTSLLISDRNDKDSKDFLFQTLEPIKERHGYKDLFIIDKNNRVLFSLNPSNNQVDSFTIVNSKKAIQLDSVLFLGFYYCNTHSEIHMDIIAPIKDNFGNALGTFILRFDPNQFLFPLIQSWPTPSKTAESLIFSNEGTQLRLLSEGKFQKNSAMNFTMPLNKEEYVGVKGVKDNDRIVEGLDYRGAKVIASIKKVPGTSWYIVSKIDQDEIFSEMIYRSETITMISVITFLFISAFTLYLYKQKQSATYKNLFLKEKELAETKEEYKTALYSIGDAVIVTDRHSLVKQMNVVAEELTGWKENEAKGKKLDEVFRIINEETKHQEQNPVKRVLKEGTIIGLANHTLLISKDGKEIPIADSGSPIKNDEDQIIGVILVFRDQTEERAKEIELFESNKKFSKIFQHSSDSISLTDVVTGKIFEVNDGFIKMFGYKREEALGKTTLDLGLWANPDDRVRMIEILKEKGHIKNFELFGLQKNGNKITALMSGEILVFNNVQYLLVTSKDITERKNAEEELNQSNSLLEAALESTVDAILVVDHEGKILRFNNKFIELWRIPESIIQSREDADALNYILDQLKFPEEFLKKVNELYSNKMAESFDVLEFKDGRIFERFSRPQLINNIAVGRVWSFRDITERKYSEKALKVSEEKYKMLLEFASDAFFQGDAEGNFLTVNDQAVNLTGYSKDELLKMNMQDIFSKETLDSNPLRYDRLLSGETVKNEREILKKDGLSIPAEMTSKQMPDGTYQSFFRDVTSRKIIERELRDSEEKFRKAFITSPDSININRLSDGRYVSINSGFTKVTGYTEEEVIGKTSAEIQIWTDISYRNEFVEKLKSSNLVENFEAKFRAKGGRLFDGLMSAAVIELNKEPHIISITRDITERRKAEEKLMTLSYAVEQSPASIVITDINGNIEYINSKFTELTGYSFDEAKGENSRILKSETVSSDDYKQMWDDIVAGKEWHGEFHNKKKNGDYYWESASISPILNDKGEITNFLAIKQDITEQKRMTTELIEAKEKAEEMNRVKAYFFANMSHELRTPFVGIVGFSELLADSLTNPDEKEMAEQILKSSKRLTDTLNKILNVTRLEFNKIELRVGEINIIDLVDQLILLFSKSAANKNIGLKTNHYKESILVKTDGRLLEEILSNLINNAIRYTNKGFIEVSTDLQSEKDSDYLVLKVFDTGVGIPKDKQEIIWQEFRQVSEGMNRSFEGTGLGLTIIKKYIETLKGNITLESEVGKGSIFVITVPVEKTKNLKIEQKEIATTKQMTSSGKQHNRKPNILYVEDDVIALSYVDKVLRTFYQVDTAFNSTIALELVNKNKYEAMLLDINLGKGIDGVELMQMIRKIDGCDKIPIVAVTAYAAESDKIEFLAKGFTHYLSKPFTSVDLRGLLSRIFS